MKKTMYSLLLDENVVRAVDQLAHRKGCSRSALVNRLLAEQLGLMTPERRIGEVLQALDSLIRPDQELVPLFVPNALSMSMKSALDYKYRPTVKYEVELYRSGTDAFGQLIVTFRTQSSDLLAAMDRFFELWKRIEGKYLIELTGYSATYTPGNGKYLRVLSMPERDCGADELASAISEYVHLFDKLLKGYLSGRLSAAELERQYAAYTATADLLI